MDSAPVKTLLVLMPDLCDPKPRDDTVSDEWMQVQRDLPESRVIEELLKLARIDPASDAASAPEVDLQALAKRAKVRIEYGVPSSTARKGGGLVISVPRTYPRWDGRFTIARALAESAIETVCAKCTTNDAAACDHSPELKLFVENPLPIHVDAVASAILMPRVSFGAQVSELGRSPARIAGAFAVPVAAAKLRLLTPGVLA